MFSDKIETPGDGLVIFRGHSRIMEEEIAETLAEIYRLTFFDGACIPRFDCGHWWLAYGGADAVGFAGLVPSTLACQTGYFSRVGVLSALW